jgi:hypothetical protein
MSGRQTTNRKGNYMLKISSKEMYAKLEIAEQEFVKAQQRVTQLLHATITQLAAEETYSPHDLLLLLRERFPAVNWSYALIFRAYREKFGKGFSWRKQDQK